MEVLLHSQSKNDRINSGDTLRQKFDLLIFHFLHLTFHILHSAHVPMHYGAAVKLGQKWPTLTNYFSMDFDHRVPKIDTQLPQLPNYWKKNKYGKLIFEEWEINPKNLLGVIAQVKIGLKKNPLAKINHFYKRAILSKGPQIANKMVQSLKIQIHKYV